MESGHVVTAREIDEACRTIDYRLKPFDIILMNTSAGEACGSDGYVGSGCGFRREATLWLLDRGIKVVGTLIELGRALFVHTEAVCSGARPSHYLEGHKTGREGAYCQIEKLASLEVLPATGFAVSCFPVKIKAGSAGFSRVVAFIR
jgi:kynurenine formamidase